MVALSIQTPWELIEARVLGRRAVKAVKDRRYYQLSVGGYVGEDCYTGFSRGEGGLVNGLGNKGNRKWVMERMAKCWKNDQ